MSDKIIKMGLTVSGSKPINTIHYTPQTLSSCLSTTSVLSREKNPNSNRCNGSHSQQQEGAETSNPSGEEPLESSDASAIEGGETTDSDIEERSQVSEETAIEEAEEGCYCCGGGR